VCSPSAGWTVPAPFRVYVPMIHLSSGPPKRWHMPGEQMTRVEHSIRRVARLIWSLHLTIQARWAARSWAVPQGRALSGHAGICKALTAGNTRQICAWNAQAPFCFLDGPQHLPHWCGRRGVAHKCVHRGWLVSCGTQDGFDEQMMEVLQTRYPAALLEGLGTDSVGALSNMVAVFPHRLRFVDWVPTVQLDAFAAAVATLVQVPQRITGMSRSYLTSTIGYLDPI
jgi:hypothetical protein